MRKIVSKDVEKKKQKRNQIIVGGVLIVVMFFSVVGYSFQGTGQKNSDTISYNGIQFVNQNGLWYLIGEDIQFSFKYHPEQINETGIIENTIEDYQGKPLYISSENLESRYEISRNLYSTGLVQRIQAACPENETCEGDIPTINCENNFIIIKISNETLLTQEENCINIQGPQEKLTELTDEFLFKILGVK